jgi:SAM-dependent methyltransferase
MIDWILRKLEYAHDHLRGRQRFSKSELDAVQTYHANYQRDHFRSDADCAETTGIPLERARRIKEYLFEFTNFGGFLETGTPHQHLMYAEILRRFPALTHKSRILEIGPGRRPMFPPEYDWTGVDKNAIDNVVYFEGHRWTTPDGRPIITGAWETIADDLAANGVERGFDLIVASHSFEHVHTPIRCLRQCLDLLKVGGHLVLFVPDGLAAENIGRSAPTHTLYITPDMADELFRECGGFSDVTVEPFRSSHDIVIMARKAHAQ